MCPTLSSPKAHHCASPLQEGQWQGTRRGTFPTEEMPFLRNSTEKLHVSRRGVILSANHKFSWNKLKVQISVPCFVIPRFLNFKTLYLAKSLLALMFRSTSTSPTPQRDSPMMQVSMLLGRPLASDEVLEAEILSPPNAHTSKVLNLESSKMDRSTPCTQSFQ